MNEFHASEGAERGAGPAQAEQLEEHGALRVDDRHRRRRALIAGGAGLAVLIGLTAGGVSYASGTESASSSSTTIVFPGGSRGAFGGGITLSPFAGGSFGGQGSGSSSSAAGAGTATTDAVPASAAQTAGVVTITSDLAFEGARSAGTGIILTSDGMILTNNHVVEGATSISVTVESTGQAYTARVVGTDPTGQAYTARVVGTDPTDDIAVLQLQGASGLTPAALDTDGVAVGDAVTAIGNAEGTGHLVAAPGSVTGLDRSVTTQAEAGIAGETLGGMIQTDADIVSGDSGGPLVDASGAVIGIDTAASSGAADITGFAIPISKALDIVATIEAGADTSTVEIGYPAFLGVSLSPTAPSSPDSRSIATSSGASIAGVVEGGPAAEAGLAAGDTVTALDGTPIASADALSDALAQREPGETVTVTWVDASGALHSAAATLGEGPVA